MRDFEKQILLQIIDNAWKDHLAEVDALRQGIGLRSYASKNPKLDISSAKSKPLRFPLYSAQQPYC